MWIGGRGACVHSTPPLFSKHMAAMAAFTRVGSHTKHDAGAGAGGRFAVAVARLTPRNWGVSFTPRRRQKARTPLDRLDSLDFRPGRRAPVVPTPRPGRAACDHCGSDAASARLHCLRNTSRVDDVAGDWQIALCDRWVIACVRARPIDHSVH